MEHSSSEWTCIMKHVDNDRVKKIVVNTVPMKSVLLGQFQVEKDVADLTTEAKWGIPWDI